MKQVIDLTGKTFGKLTVLHLSDDYIRGKARWLCRCECGQTTVAFACNIVHGHTTSCGCHKKENYKTMNLTHGATAGKMKRKNEYPRSYKIWVNMRQRCNNQAQAAFKDYGARGITICKRWNDYANFAADMGEPPPGTSLDRIDNDGQYSIENCRWATKVEQARNKRSAKLITYNSETRSLAEWAEYLGISRGALHNRLFRGWDLERVFNQPYRKR